MKTYYGFYRAKVTNNKDPEKYGRVKIWIPDLMPDIDSTDPNVHLWARPANNPLGGRNNIDDEDQYYSGTSYIPKKGSWVWCFFENGNPNRPYYWGALDIENSPVLAENQYGENYQHKWTIFKSSQGRCIVISDDPDDMRLEITGKKRKIKNPPSGDVTSVYNIIDNQTTILLDERSGKEKVLIKTYKGDYLNFDIETRKLHIYTADDIHIKSDNSIYIEAKNNIHLKSGANTFISAGGEIHENAAANVNIDGANTYIQSGTSIPALNANPIGIRNQNITECSIIVSSIAAAIHLVDISQNLSNDLNEISDIADASIGMFEDTETYIDDTITKVSTTDPVALKNDIDSSVTQLSSLESQVNDVENHLNNLDSTFNEVNEKTSNSLKEIDKLSRIYDARNPNTKSTYKKIEEAKKALLNMDGVIKKQKNQLGSTESIFNQIHSDVSSIDSNEMKNSVDVLDASLPTLNNAKTDVITAKTTLSSKTTTFKNETAATKLKMDSFAASVNSLKPLQTVTANTVDDMATEKLAHEEASIDRAILQEKMISGFNDVSSKKSEMMSSVDTSVTTLDLSSSINTARNVLSNISNIGAASSNISNGISSLYAIKNSIGSSSLNIRNIGYTASEASNALIMINDIMSNLGIIINNSVDQLPEEKRSEAITSSSTVEDLCDQMFAKKGDFDNSYIYLDNSANNIENDSQNSFVIPDPTGTDNKSFEDLQAKQEEIETAQTLAINEIEEKKEKMNKVSQQYTIFTESESYLDSVTEHKSRMINNPDYEKRKQRIENQLVSC